MGDDCHTIHKNACTFNARSLSRYRILLRYVLPETNGYYQTAGKRNNRL